MKTKIKTTLLTVLLFTLMLPSGVFAYASGNRINTTLSVFDNLQPVSKTPETLTPSGFPPSTFETSRQGFDRNFSKTHPDLTPLEPRYLLGFELRFLRFCIRTGIIYTDPFGQTSELGNWFWKGIKSFLEACPSKKEKKCYAAFTVELRPAWKEHVSLREKLNKYTTQALSEEEIKKPWEEALARADLNLLDCLGLIPEALKQEMRDAALQASMHPE